MGLCPEHFHRETGTVILAVSQWFCLWLDFIFKDTCFDCGLSVS